MGGILGLLVVASAIRGVLAARHPGNATIDNLTRASAPGGGWSACCWCASCSGASPPSWCSH
jgi:UPF0716 family protein affecting phage T7 exclusion